MQWLQWAVAVYDDWVIILGANPTSNLFPSTIAGSEPGRATFNNGGYHAAMLEAGMLKRWRMRTGAESPNPAASIETGQKNDAVRNLAQSLRVHPLIVQLLLLRGIKTAEQAVPFLAPKLTQLHDPAQIPGLDQAACRIAQAVRDGQRIVIYGDYDVDGITASSILWHTLHTVGAAVTTYVPHRVEEGYGIHADAIRQIVESESRPLIISVDCGITAVEPARVARELGVDLIITDHHEFHVDHLPDAYALVHPRLPGSEYPFPHLCGAGVAFKLAWQFCKVYCNSEKVPEHLRELLVDLLSLAALGTITDVVPLVGENRVITTFGLGQIKHTRFVGLNALIDASRLREEKIDAYHVGFGLGPRLNACGRMGHARQAVHMLTAAGQDEAISIAKFLTQENDRRRATERVIFQEAKEMVIAQGFDHADCRAIVLGKEGWHPGVVGIVASRLVETFSRPVVLLSYPGGDDGEAHGSARSVNGISIHEAFSHCATHLSTYGGHAMAAGLRLAVNRVEEFRKSLVAYVNNRLNTSDLIAVLEIDAECELEDITLDLVTQLNKLAPFGASNPSPVLCARGVILEQNAYRMGANGSHLSLMLRQDSRVVRAVAWNQGELAPRLPAGVKIDIAFEPKISQWQGVSKAELHIKDLRIVPRQ